MTHPDDTTCGCTEFAATHKFSASRRRFLRNLAAVAGAGAVTPVLGSAFMQATFASSPVAQNVVVVLSMRGGVDGMSLVVPHGDPAYEAARPSIHVPREQLLFRDELFGLHPAFAPLAPMWRSGSFAAVHAVGLPQPNRSHFAALEEIEDADPGSDERRGWLNRLISLDEEVTPIEAVQLGSTLVPTALYGSEPVLAVGRLDDMYLPSRDNPEAYERRRSSLRTAWDGVPGPFGRGARSALTMSKAFEDLAEEPHDVGIEARYPATDLGRALSQTARLIRADMGVEVVTLDCGSWDMHVNIGTPEGGLMVTALDELALGLSVFFEDLGGLASKVTVVTISEFGRRLTQNAGNGLDHGYGNVMLLLGAGVNGGRYLGSWPGLGAGALIDGDLAVTRDYRSVLAEVVRSRFDVPISKVFPGFQPETIGAMHGA